MKKVIVLSLLSICIPFTEIMAQTDAKAKSVLDAVSKKVNSLKSLKADFTLSLTRQQPILHQR